MATFPHISVNQITPRLLMSKLYFFLQLAILIFLYPFSANATDMSDIIKKVEENLNGKTAQMNISMKITTSRTTRTMEMESYSIGSEKSFIKITYPKKDKGITFLKMDNSMWQYVPRIEKIIKIPASMMLQSWMGSDFTNDDLVRESSISEDYTSSLIAEEEAIYRVLLIPLEDAPVVWGKIVMEISKQYFLPTKVLYYDEDQILIRELHYQQVEKIEDRYYPTHWVMTPKTADKADHQTVIDVSNAMFDKDISGKYFNKRALKKYSR